MNLTLGVYRRVADGAVSFLLTFAVDGDRGPTTSRASDASAAYPFHSVQS